MEEYTSRLEEKVAYESRFFTLLTNALPQIVWTALPDGSFDYFNHQWFEFTSLSEAKSLKDGWLQIVHPDDQDKARMLWIQAIKTSNPFQAELRFKDNEGDCFKWFLIRAIVSRNTDGEVLKWFGTCTDINDHKREQEKKDEFIAITSHELKTPLTSIKVYLQLLQMQLKDADNKPAYNLSKEMNQQINRLNDLINDLLDISLLDTGKLKLHRQLFDFDKFIIRSTKRLQMLTPTHKLLVEGQSGQRVYADRRRIEQALTNLVSNGIKYSPNADKVLIKISNHNKEVKVSVIDFGLGIPKTDQKYIFERFYRSNGLENSSLSGFGLGLYITNEVLKREGGKVSVDSRVGKGSTFSFTLPLPAVRLNSRKAKA